MNQTHHTRGDQKPVFQHIFQQNLANARVYALRSTSDKTESITISKKLIIFFFKSTT